MSSIHESSLLGDPAEPLPHEQDQEPGQPERLNIHMPEHPPTMTNTIMGITIAVFLLQMGSGLLQSSGLWNHCPYLIIPIPYFNDLPACYGMKVNVLISAYGEWWRLLAPMLLHAGLIHIFFNMYALRILGTSLERFYGHWQLLLLYVVSGFVGVVASYGLTEASSLGASTAVFGLIGAQGVFAYHNRDVFGPFARRALRDIIFLAGLNLLIGFSVPGIDNWGHIGGLVGGMAVAWFGGPKYKLEGLRPNYHLENERGDAPLVWSGVATMLLFGALAFLVMVQWTLNP
ncbi:MAG: rhomboid family intramembrane serine protease [Anaerolineae bacterium]|nr:rhomboid family intramembrane serine protease [Anaerolineae bacterium]